MKKTILILSALLILSGCETCQWQDNQPERQRVFKECLNLIPEGPRQTTYNDWDDVVNVCDRVSRNQTQEFKCRK